ncbi:hypothetical protein [Nocardia sp. 348MFTsu5.1]|uniref:hypothetical protein n=1 Tax=Nocardia sp. 348MFTsu5.1 TaxID=1172185 RepID=UPI0012DF0342|nr:hypothetical protein [Nocardia sp. 348MFTsu5.1]
MAVVASLIAGCGGPSDADIDPGRNVLSLPRIAWEGGSEYWRQFANASDWTSPDFFPIGLWYGSFDTAEQVRWDQHLGINFYTGGLWKASDFEILKSTGMYWVGGKVNEGFDSSSKNWPGRLTDDEVDGRFPSPAAGRAHLQELEDELRGHGQFLYGNYTQMVVGKDLAVSDQEKYVNDYTDAVSLDHYLYTNSFCDFDPYRGDQYVNPIPQSTCRTASSYGRMTDSLRARDAADGRLQAIWNFIEVITGVGDEKSFVRNIAPAEIKGAAMASVINEARGIVWFQQALGGDCLTTQPLRNAQDQGESFCGKNQVAAMGEINNLLHSLAAVLNTQSYDWDFGSQIDTMLKVIDRQAYIFAMTDGGSGERTFTVPAGLAGSAEVVGEGRTLEIRDGKFRDSFPVESTYHIYKIALE